MITLLLNMAISDKYELTSANTIYFVCSGNIIRSSFAELYARHLDNNNLKFKSYGITYHNTRIHERSEQELLRRNITQSWIDKFRPTHITDIEFDDDDVHIVMTSKHREQLLQHGVAENKIILIKSLLGQTGDVADPYFADNYDEAYSTIAAAVKQILDITSPN